MQAARLSIVDKKRNSKPYFYDFYVLLHIPYTLLLSMPYFCLFLSAVWLLHDQLQVIIAGIASLTRC